MIRSPYKVGDRLWVRETFSTNARGAYPMPDAWYRADFSAFDDPASVYSSHHSGCEAEKTGRPQADCFVCAGGVRWKPSIFMPRKLSRITLEITAARHELLQNISEDDARAEGVDRDTSPCDHTRFSCDEIGCLGKTYRSSFCELWDSINGERAPWECNPLVWVVTFKRLDGSYPTGGKPILFSAPMVRAILGGRKTQTRRVVR